MSKNNSNNNNNPLTPNKRKLTNSNGKDFVLPAEKKQKSQQLIISLIDNNPISNPLPIVEMGSRIQLNRSGQPAKKLTIKLAGRLN